MFLFSNLNLIKIDGIIKYIIKMSPLFQDILVLNIIFLYKRKLTQGFKSKWLFWEPQIIRNYFTFMASKGKKEGGKEASHTFLPVSRYRQNKNMQSVHTA